MVINVLIERKMKKEYIYPEMEVVEIKAPQLLAGSPEVPTDGDYDPNNDVLDAPGMDTNMFGF